MNKSKKNKKQRCVDVNFWYYDDGKNFVPLISVFGSALTRDEENVLTIMKAQNPNNVKKTKAIVVFN